jgi:hypothetical protein
VDGAKKISKLFEMNFTKLSSSDKNFVEVNHGSVFVTGNLWFLRFPVTARARPQRAV